MGGKSPLQYWEVWYPEAAATGTLIGRGQIDPTDKIIFHAAPAVVTVEVSDEDGHRVAYGKNLQKTTESPMCLLKREGDRVVREDFWPTEADYGTVVLLPGGEAGVLQSWWNAPDQKEWRWQVEFYNSRR